jgi:DNA gyrase subunit B
MIPILADVESIRRRPGMYLGNTRERGTEQFVYELVANVLDLYLINQATFVNVTLNGTTITVVDDGPGLPFDETSEEEGNNLVSHILTHLHSSPSFNNHAPHVHMAFQGIGLAPLNALSETLKVQSWRKGLLWEQRFSKGFAQSPATVIDKGNGRGTTIEIIPDPELFGGAKPRLDALRRVFFEIAHLFSGLKIGLQEERFHAPQGLKMFGQMMLANMLKSLTSEPFHTTLCHENVWIEAAVFSCKQPLNLTFSWVNGIKTVEQGSHIQGFSQALKSVGWKPELSLIHVVMYDPN